MIVLINRGLTGSIASTIGMFTQLKRLSQSASRRCSARFTLPIDQWVPRSLCIEHLCLLSHYVDAVFADSNARCSGGCRANCVSVHATIADHRISVAFLVCLECWLPLRSAGLELVVSLVARGAPVQLSASAPPIVCRPAAFHSLDWQLLELAKARDVAAVAALGERRCNFVLWDAAENGDTALVDVLLRAGVAVSAVNWAIQIAARHGFVAIARRLLREPGARDSAALDAFVAGGHVSHVMTMVAPSVAFVAQTGTVPSSMPGRAPVAFVDNGFKSL